ncbi:MAG: nucleoside 2-deoxyribosyltransferase [Candidatus Pacebacteria bacterium]|nr:nucleoside 2-deoxyribosyltransferase [Candidatus Paceibacterota bacterium]
MENKKIKIYLAGPLFSEAEKNFNLELAEKLETVGFEVFLPQRDGVEKNKPPYNEMGPNERRKAMFKFDCDKLLEADIFLIILDGRVPDEGACVELGIAYAQKYLNRDKKILMGLQTDVRAAFIGSKLNPMLSVPLDFIVETEKRLLEILKEKI